MSLVDHFRRQSTQPRPDASQGNQIPAPGFTNPAPWFYSTMYPMPGITSPPLALLSNTVPTSSEPTANAGGHHTDVASYQNQFSMPLWGNNSQNSRAQQSLSPSPRSLLGNVDPCSVSPQDPIENQHVSPAPPPLLFEWSHFVQLNADIPSQQNQEVFQKVAVGTEASQECACGSTHGHGCGAGGTRSVPQVQPNHPNQSGPSNAPQENVMPLELTRQTKDGDQYFCAECGKWVLERRRKHHDKKHDPKEGPFHCLICAALGLEHSPLSRKDALKRHILKKHWEYAGLLADLTLNILVPRQSNVYQDLQVLRAAMEAHLLRTQSTGVVWP